MPRILNKGLIWFMQTLSQASFFSPCEQSLPLSSWVRRRKGDCTWFTSNLLKSPQASHLDQSALFSLVKLLFFFLECEHRFIDKLIAITEPAVASRRLLGLGSKLYPSNMGRMLNKGLIWFMQSFSSIFFSHPASRASFCPFWWRGEKEARIKPLRSPQPEPITEWVYTKIQYSSDQCHSLIFYIQFASDLSSSSKPF